MICPNAPWYWPFHRFVEWREGTYRRRVRTVTGAPLSRCPCGEVRVDR